MSPIIVTPCPPERCQEVIDLKRATRMFYAPLDRMEVCRARLQHDDHSILVAASGNRLVGVVFLAFDPGVSKLSDLVVAEDLRRHGIGRLLMHCAEHIVLRRGGIAINAYVENANTASLALMRSLRHQTDPLDVSVAYKILVP